MTKPTTKHMTLAELTDTVTAVTGERASRVYEIVYVALVELERTEPGALPHHLVNDLRAE